MEITSRQTESTTLFANPDGKTLRMETYVDPIRIRKAKGGEFTPIDTTLVERNGVISPKAARGNLTLSTGNDDVLLKSAGIQGTTEITAPRKLPSPKLTKNTATYRAAYDKDVDLLVTATPTGFRQKIVIRARPTGPVSFRMPVELPKGMSYGTGESGRLTILSEDGGRKVADIPPTLLLDADAADPNGPIDAGKVGKATIDLGQDGSTLVFTPDTAFLADPTVVYPVTLMAADSDWWEPGIGNDTFVNNADYPNGYSNSSLDRILVGKSNSGTVRWRGYIRFDEIPIDSLLRGATVDNADLTLWNYLSNSCGLYVGSGITARRITQRWDVSELTWANQPLATSEGADTEYGAYSTDCSGSMNYAWDLIHSVNDIAQKWADGEPNYGFQLTAGNESDLTNWRRYRSKEQTDGGLAHGPKLTVDFTPAPQERTSVFFSSMERMTTPPSYEEAIARQEYQPESVENDFLTDEDAEAIESQREEGDEEAYLVGTDKLESGGPSSEAEDISAPQVTAVQPANDAVDVPLDSPIKITFSEETDEAKMVLRDSGGSQVVGTSAFDATGRTLTFTAAQSLRPGTTYTVEVSDAIDSWENTMDSYSWSFTTVNQAAAHWTFDEGDGHTAADSSGQSHNASLTDTVAWIPGKHESAVSNTPSQAQIASSREAVRQGKAVEVTDKTTENSVTYAQPDGRTFKTEITSGPVRTKRDGVWIPIDTSLAEQGNVLKPKALAPGITVEVSNGGTGAFVKLNVANGQRYALRWPTALPKPTLVKNVATYTDVAGKGADLVVTVLPTGFRHDVVLRERPDKPLEVRIGVESGDLTLSEGKGGRLRLTDGKSRKLVASAPQPVMWDADARGRLVKGKRPTTRHAKITTDVVTRDGRTELVLKPDHKFLTDPATVYPVRIDPATTLPFNHDVELADTNDADFPADPTTQYLMAGRMYGLFLSRIYLRFDTASLAGTTVTDAKLSLHNIDAPSCGTQVGAGIQVRRVTGAWDENTLQWANKPASTAEDAQTNRQAFTQDCGAARLEWPVTGIAQDWAGGAANHGLVLQHPNEANTADNYRVFTSSEDTDYNAPPTLTVTTAGPASAPTATGLAITPAQVNGGTTTVTSLTPQLSATVTDAAPGSLTGGFEIEHDPAAPAGQGSGQIWAATSTPVTSGSQATVTVPAAKLADGWKVRWRARAANTTAATTSAWSAWQSATVDVPNPTVDGLQVTPSQQVNGTTVATSLTPNLLAVVTDPAAQPLRAEVEVEHDPAAPAGQGSGPIWAGSADNVPSGTQATITVPAAKLTDGWK
ncbi:DNRLRE domain-containing protein, partial [Streptosporangium saharense]|uniref:DNRLRE domain-containing protein n=1 Tax=Streptosporangium saharense TaxID=1706840 RepID=UPI0036828380